MCLLFKIDNSPVFQAADFLWATTEDGDKNFGPEVVMH